MRVESPAYMFMYGKNERPACCLLTIGIMKNCDETGLWGLEEYVRHDIVLTFRAVELAEMEHTNNTAALKWSSSE